MVRKVGMVHTVAKLVPVFEELADEVMPGTEVIHLVDEGLLKDIVAGGELTPDRVSRLASLASFAEASGAEAVMLTCSTVGPGVDTAKENVEVPFLKVDEAMADRAVQLGPRIGVIATLHTTLTPTSDLVRDRASAQGREVQVETVLCQGAFEALGTGDTDTHDRIVIESLKELMSRVDVVVLAQASMARVADLIPEDEKVVPILSSPRLGVERLRSILAGEKAIRAPTFKEKYEALERKFYQRVQADFDDFGLSSTLLRNIKPENPVDFVLVAKEPSLARGKLLEEDRNFSSSIEDFILHFCIRNYLCKGAETYYLTDLSKGAMAVERARDDSLRRYENWYPLLKEELRLVAKPGKTRMIAIGNDVKDFLSSKNLCEDLKKVLHYSPVATGHREKAIQCWADSFPKFLETIEVGDIVKTARTVWTEIGHSQSEIERRVKQLQRGSGLTESRQKLMFYYKNRFEELRTASHIVLDTTQV